MEPVERVAEHEYYRNILFICMKIAQWNPPKTVSKEKGGQRASKKK
jgi:hypothetical protein